MTYLACPYSHPDPAVRQWRFEQANRAAARLMAEGHLVFSPISHSHSIALAGGLPLDWKFWQEYDQAILAQCERMIVLRVPGWDGSIGVGEEVMLAQGMGLPVEYIDG